MSGKRGETPQTERVSAQEGYALWADTYDFKPNPLLALEERKMDPLLPSLKGKFVLDVACGTGRWLGKVLARGARGGAGIDLSPEMLSRASTQTPLQGKLARGDCAALPFHNGIADLVICSFALGYIQNPLELASELARVAHSRASILVSDFHPAGHRQGWRRTFRHGNRVIEIAGHIRSPEEIRRSFEGAGLRLLRSIDCYLGDPERGLFERSGKIHLFPTACETAAVLIMEFQHREAPSGHWQ